MEYIKRVLSSMRQKATTTADIKDIELLTFGSGAEHLLDSQHLSSYKDSLYLFIAVSKISKRVAGIPLELYKIKNKRGDVAEILDHPLLALLSTPNAYQSQSEFIQYSVIHYLLAGDLFWLLDRNGSKIEQMAVLRPDRVTIVLAPDKKSILAYEYRAGTIQRFRPEDIVHIKNPDPTDPLRGVGVVRPAASRILTEKEATRYQATFFQNQARPDLAVFVDGTVTDEQADLARSDWKRTFGKDSQASRVGFFGAAVKSVQELTKTPKEMDFIKSQNFLRDDILAALSVPKAMVTSDDVNLANAKEAYRVFLQEAVVPVLDAILDKVNSQLVPQFDEALFLSFTDPTPIDRDFQLKETTGLLQAGVITPNEARALYNYEPMEGADNLKSHGPTLNPAVTETAKAILRSRPVLVKKLTAMEKMVALIHSNEPQRRMNSIFPDQKSKILYAKAYNDNADKKAEEVKAEVDAFHDGMLERVLATDLSFNGFMDTQAEKKLAKDHFGPIMTRLYQEGGQATLDALFRKSETHFFADAVLLAAIEGRVEFFTASMVDTTFEVLKGKIADGIKEGHGIEKIGRSIRDYFTDMTVKRARTIAQTETNFVLSKATNDAYAQSQVVTGKEWLTVGDDKVRPEHVENNGKIVAKGAAFPSGEHHPGEQSVNCRCVLLPTV